MDENIDVPFLWLWSCKGSSNCLNLDQAVRHVRCFNAMTTILRSESWSKKKNGRHHVIGSPSRPRAPKISRMTSLAAHAPFIGWACAVHGARILLLLLGFVRTTGIFVKLVFAGVLRGAGGRHA